MLNRIAQYIQRAPPREGPEAYAVIEVGSQLIPVYAWMGARVASKLQRFWTPRWITFRDIAGASFTVRSSSIAAVWETTPATRAKTRAFYRAREREYDEDVEQG